MKDFYLAEEDHTKRPRIFGMTASPVDAKVDVVKAAKYVTLPTTMGIRLISMSVTDNWKLFFIARSPPLQTYLCFGGLCIDPKKRC